MSLPPHAYELASFLQSIPHSTQDLPTPADPAQIPPNTPISSTFFDLDDFGLGSSQIDLSGINFAVTSDATGDWFATADTTTEIQHLDEGDADYPWNDNEQLLFFEELDPLVPGQELVESPAPAPAPKDVSPSGRDADMPKVNDAAPQPGPRGGGACSTSTRVEEEAPFSSFKSAIEQDLLGQGHTPTGCDLDAMAEKIYKKVEAIINELRQKKVEKVGALLTKVGFEASTEKKLTSWNSVRFTGPDSKGRKPHQAGWKEMSMKGLRAVADPSSPQPPAPGQQQRYVGLKKTLERDDGNGNKWRAHEYTPLLPSDDGSDKLIPAEFSLRVEFKQDEPPPPPAASLSMKRKEDEPPLAAVAFTKRPKIAPKKSPVWEHMTRLYIKVAPATNKDRTQRRKNPHYKVMYAICHHCDQVFNADSSNGTHNLSNHLDCCNDCKCTHSHSR